MKRKVTWNCYFKRISAPLQGKHTFSQTKNMTTFSAATPKTKLVKKLRYILRGPRFKCSPKIYKQHDNELKLEMCRNRFKEQFPIVLFFLRNCSQRTVDSYSYELMGALEHNKNSSKKNCLKKEQLLCFCLISFKLTKLKLMTGVKLLSFQLFSVH